jgi:hypothetical protein
MTTWVAITQIRHGEGGGEVTVFEPGETVTGLDKDTMYALYAGGSLTEKGSRNDPSTWVNEDAEFQPTTPRLVEEVLHRQMFEQAGPGDVETKTQTNQDAPKDPAKLLAGPNQDSHDNVTKVEDLSGPSTTPPAKVTTTVTKANESAKTADGSSKTATSDKK